MKKLVLAFSLVSLVISTSACDDSKMADNIDVSKSTAAKSQFVLRTDVLDALLAGEDQATEIKPEAKCLATSNFPIDPENAFMIKKAPESDEYNSTPYVIVSPIYIVISDSNSSTRGEGCASGDLSYAITAGEELPINIEQSEKVEAKRPLDRIGRNTPVAYPDSCKIFAHFEAYDTNVCGPHFCVVDDTAQVAEPEENNTEEQDTLQSCAPDHSPCSTTAFYTLKLVVDDLDCNANPYLKK